MELRTLWTSAGATAVARGMSEMSALQVSYAEEVSSADVVLETSSYYSQQNCADETCAAETTSDTGASSLSCIKLYQNHEDVVWLDQVQNQHTIVWMEASSSWWYGEIVSKDVVTGTHTLKWSLDHHNRLWNQRAADRLDTDVSKKTQFEIMD